MNAVEPDTPFQPNDYQNQPTSYQTQTPPPVHDAPSEQGAGNIDKIRDIIFGSNMRDYEQRFARLEETLRRESLDIRDATRRHLESLEAFVHKEFAAIEARLKTERDERADSHSKLAADLATHSSSLFRKIGEFENQEAQAKREIRKDLMQQNKEGTTRTPLHKTRVGGV